MIDDPNQSEWERPENWRGGLMGIYVAPRDPRIWVPKRNPWMGFTLNFAHRASWWWMAFLLGVPLAVVFVTIWLAAR